MFLLIKVYIIVLYKYCSGNFPNINIPTWKERELEEFRKVCALQDHDYAASLKADQLKVYTVYITVRGEVKHSNPPPDSMEIV